MARELEIDVSEDDWVEFQIFTYKRIGLFDKTVKRRRTNTSFILLIVLSFVVYTVKDGTTLFVSLLFLLLFLTISLVKAGSQFEQAQRTSVKAMIGLDNANRVLGKKRLVLGESELVVSDEYEVTRYLKDSFISLDQDSGRIYLYRDKISAVIVPLTSFPNGEAVRAFLDELVSSGLVLFQPEERKA